MTVVFDNSRSQGFDLAFVLIKVKDADSKQPLGSLRIPLSRILKESDLSLDQWFELDNSGPASRIYVNTVLRVPLQDSFLELL